MSVVGFGIPWVRVSRVWLTTRMPCSTVSLPPRHTGRADFPHPAFPDTFAAGLRRELTYTLSGIKRPKSRGTFSGSVPRSSGGPGPDPDRVVTGHNRDFLAIE